MKKIGLVIILIFFAFQLHASEIYNQPFTSDLGDMLTENITGEQVWMWEFYDDGCATMNGYDGSKNANEDWLITPAMDFTNYTNLELDFREAINFEGGSVDDNETVWVSTDYSGSGNPYSANWTQLTVTGRSGGNSWTFVDVNTVDLSSYDGESTVYIAYKYLSTDSNAATWEIGELTVSGTGSDPEITVNPNSLSGFYYLLGSGPSNERTFNVSGANLIENISINAPTNFEISESSGSGFGTAITLIQTGGNVNTTDIYVRLKSGLALGDYNDEEVIVSSTGLVDTITCSGSVLPESPDLMLSKIADPGDNYNARFVQIFNASDSTINFDSQTWYLSKQANGSTWQEVQLLGSIETGTIFNAAYDSTVFDTSYGFAPDQSNSYLNANGDDGYFLFYNGDHSSGVMVDAYGVVDQNGTGEPWEYEDSKAVRNAGTSAPNPVWTASEWTITSADVADCNPETTNLGGLQPPENLVIQMDQPTSGDVQVSWDEVAEANSYIIYRAPQPYGTYAPVDTVNTTSFIDENVLSAFVDKLFYYVEASTDSN